MIASNTVIGGRYRVVRVLGGGGMKMVYLAEDLRLGSRRCAFAEMVDGFTSPEAQQQAIAAFQREADMLAQLSNEHIPHVFDRFSEANHHYLVMEYIDGATLEDEIKRNGGKLATGVVVDAAIQILDTLEYLHGLIPPVIYRDLKPSNVMITAAAQVKLVDFGIARFFAPLTNATMIGTQGYAPPEQYRGKVEARSDLYALGATMHHALSGRDPAAEPPFSFPPLRKVAPEIDAGLAAIVDQALAYDVGRRIADAADFKRRLIELRDPGRKSSIATAASGSLKTQLQLPLGGGAAQKAPSVASSSTPAAIASAPTVVTANPEIRCPSCTRTIPADSRFCSYCAASLPGSSWTSGPADATVILSPAAAAAPSQERLSPERRARGSSRRRLFGLPVVLVIVIFAATFAVVKQMTRSGDDTTPAGSGADSSGDNPGLPDSSALSPATRLQLIGLRQFLDARGYNQVKLQMNGTNLVLSGTVPSEADRAEVKALCLTLGFGSPIDDLRIAPDPNAEG
jgi:serine/threonine protein kinase